MPYLRNGKLRSPEFEAILTPDLQYLAGLFSAHGHEVRLVGGVVRDLLQGKKPKDVDLATDATPDEMITIFQANRIRYIETGLQHGTLTVHINGADFEVTTLRVDRVTDGRHAEVDFTRDWRLDAERRDLTINAMALGFDGTLHDYFNGQCDLEKRRVAFVGNAKARIKEDYLRILRYFRFYGRISVKEDCHEADTLKSIQESRDGLRKIAAERIWVEMSQILCGNFAPNLLALIYRLGVADCIGMPANGNLEEFEVVWKRMRGCNPKPVSLLVSLVASTDDVYHLVHHWKLSNMERRLGLFLVINRELKPHPNPLKPYQELLIRSQPERRKEGRDNVVELLQYIGRPELAEEMKVWPEPKFPVTGGDLKALGIKPGPIFKKILEQLKEQWIDLDFKPSKEELLAICRNQYANCLGCV
jgi:tRNA nucleotidyltransferase (CCA-adding enzyme)